MPVKLQLKTRRWTWGLIAFLFGLAIVLVIVERRPGYGYYYGLAKLLDEPLDLGGIVLQKQDFRNRRQSVLICPVDVCTTADTIDLQPPIYNVPADVLLRRLDRIIMAESGAGPAYQAPGDELRRRYILRSSYLGLFETVDVWCFSIDKTHSTFALYARDLIRELAPDRAERTARWLAAIRADS